jgi:hypothetical protein
MAKSDRGKQKGPQQHAEGQHGEKTHSRFLEQLHSGPSGAERQREDAAGDPEHRERGKHRMFERREQHDEADANQEKNRAMRDINRHGHDRDDFQNLRGKERHPAMPEDDESALGPRGG